MALFSGNRDMQLFKRFSNELIDRLVGTEVDIYKISQTLTSENVYGEAVRKVYKTAVRIGCLITPEDSEWSSSEKGEDVNKQCQFAFVKDTVKDRNIVIQVGDIFNWDNTYWEVDSVKSDKYHMAHNQQTTALGEDFGLDIEIICNTHMTRRSSLSIENTYVGNPGIIPDNI